MLKFLICPAAVILFCSSCFYDPPKPTYYDISIINSTKDSLYYQVYDFKSPNNHTYNFAFDSIAASEKTAYQYRIAYKINQQKIAPGDTVKPESIYLTWKKLAKKSGGITIIFYKRDIEYLPEGTRLSNEHIKARMDYGPKQLDSVKYVIDLK